MAIEMNERCARCERMALRWTVDEDGPGSEPELVMRWLPCAAAPVARLQRVECPLRRSANPAA